MRRYLSATAVIAVLGLAGCGDTLGEQAIIGAGAGAATAVVLDGNVATGAVIGAAGNVLACNQGIGQC